ncbi:peptidoglycan-binding protein [Oceanobacillus sp. FSL H7-0719]|uniref:peptidoglycan-binding protein n=1 Tax=Oceanobacillus sp. FSL H7-0719 TaxID=2954507 RepID=UPI00324E4850
MAKIGLDIGHGFNTFPPSKGVYKNGIGYHEHDANSRIAVKLEAKLSAAGHTVFKAQQPGKIDVPLLTRTNMYFANGVDLIVSCHANAGASSASGYASFYWYNDSKAKRLSDLYEQEIKRQGFKLWGGSRPSNPNDWSNFHMCRVPAQRGVPSILLENGFMTNSGDFEWIFGAKKDEYAERCATAAFNAIQRYLGKETEKVTKPAKQSDVKSETVTKPSTPSKTASKSKWTKINGKWTGQSLFQWQFGQPVKEMQTALANNKPPFYPEKGAKNNGVDSYFGADSKNAVERFQTYYKLKVDGIPGKEVYNQIQKNKSKLAKTSTAKPKATAKMLPNATYYVKSPLFSGSGVRQVQEALASVYFYPEKGAKNNGVDGYYGSKTADAVKRFQSVHGLKADGIYGTATRKKLLQVMK